MFGLKKRAVLALSVLALSGGGLVASAQRGFGPAPAGMQVTGQVPDYVPVTDEMLRNPAPGDWLMIRRDYHATSFTPLTEITPENVDDLELVYMHPMNDNGTNQPAPIVHNGVIYLANTGGIIQAIEGTTGRVIWQNNLGREVARRGIAIYGDKIYMASGNMVIALNAITGENEWETVIGEGYNNSSGPIVADGKVIQGLGGCSRYQDEKCFLSAYDAETGEQLWRLPTIAKIGEPGGDT
jgi:alcohol dehydrogenase (cytochrome c)